MLEVFRELYKDGFLRKYPEKGAKVSSYYVPRNTEQREAAKQPPDPVQEKNVTSEVKGISAQGTKVIGIIIRAFGAAIGAAAIIISSEFSLSWTSSYLPIWIAWIVSISIPCYTSFAIEAGIFIRYTTGVIVKNRLSWPAATLLLFSTACIAMVFEMSIITIGQFNSRTKLLFTETQSDEPKNNNEKTLSILKDEEISDFGKR